MGQQGLKGSWENIDEVLHNQGLPYIPEIIQIKLISHHHDDLLVGYFEIDKIREMIARKYYWLTIQRNVKIYIKGCDVCLALKSVKHKPYGNLQSLPVPMH